MADNMVDLASVPNLAQIQAQSTSSSVPIRPQQPSTLQQMMALQVSVVSFLVHCFNTCTLPLHCLNVAGCILQATVERLESQQEAHRQELLALQAERAQRVAEA
jgi:hypothetical protein